MSQQRNKVSDSEREQNDSDQFDRFEDLTRRLLAVPKKEADAKAKELKGRRRNKSR